MIFEHDAVEDDLDNNEDDVEYGYLDNWDHMCSLPTAFHCSTMMMSLIVILIFFGDDFDADDDKDDF